VRSRSRASHWSKVGTAERGSAPRAQSVSARDRCVPAPRLSREHVADHLAVDVGVVVGDVAGGTVAEPVTAQHAGDPVAPHSGLLAVPRPD
jgi:hypothetical protein